MDISTSHERNNERQGRTDGTDRTIGTKYLGGLRIAQALILEHKTTGRAKLDMNINLPQGYQLPFQSEFSISFYI